MSTDEIEQTLKAKRRELEEMLRQRRGGADYRTLDDEVLNLERALAEARNEPHAVEPAITWPGLAHFNAVVGDSFHCAVIFANQRREHLTLHFRWVAAYKLTDVSDDLIEAHSLSGKGLRPYRAFVVKNSPWVRELELMDQAHPNHAPDRWRSSQHYLLCFKDRIFEAIARDVESAGSFGSVEDALSQAVGRVSPVIR